MKYNDIVKKRDPNWKVLQSKRTSGAGGAHKDKLHDAKYGKPKHKANNFRQALDEYDEAEWDLARSEAVDVGNLYEDGEDNPNCSRTDITRKIWRDDAQVTQRLWKSHFHDIPSEWRDDR